MPIYIEPRLAEALKEASGINAICEGRVFPLKVPQGTMLPAVVYQRVSSRPNYTLDGYSEEYVMIMINSFARTFAEAKGLALAVRRAVAEADLGGSLESEHDANNDDGNVFIVSADYRFTQKGGYCYG